MSTEAQKFQPGDLVRHRGGGPVMVVGSIHETKDGCMARVSWTTGDIVLSDTISLVALEAAADE